MEVVPKLFNVKLTMSGGNKLNEKSNRLSITKVQVSGSNEINRFQEGALSSRVSYT